MTELNVLIVGGGIGGMAATIKLKQQGIAVELIDLDRQWRVYGCACAVRISGRSNQQCCRDAGSVRVRHVLES